MKGVLYSIFDPAFPQSSSLYTELAEMMKASAPRIVFAGNPLPRLSNPLLAPFMGREQQLREHWDKIADFLERVVKPHLKQGSMVILDGCGLDAFLSAAAMADPEDCVRLEKLHHELEQQHLKRLQVPRPTYILQRTDVRLEIEHTRTTHCLLHNCGVRRLENCSRRVHSLLHAYFHKRFRQESPYWIPLVHRTQEELMELLTKSLRIPVPLPA